MIICKCNNFILDSASKTIQTLDRSFHFDTDPVTSSYFTDHPDFTDEDLSSGLRHRTARES